MLDGLEGSDRYAELVTGAAVLEDQIENKLLKETVSLVREDIESGLAFSEALAKHPKAFSPLYVAMVRAGEMGGVLEASLDRISDQLEKDDQLRRQVKGAMAYPIVVLSFDLVEPPGAHAP